MSKVEVKIDNEIWCELEVEDNVCKYKFFLLNIPCCLGGHKKTGDQGDSYWEDALQAFHQELFFRSSQEHTFEPRQE